VTGSTIVREGFPSMEKHQLPTLVWVGYFRLESWSQSLAVLPAPNTQAHRPRTQFLFVIVLEIPVLKAAIRCS
jgi:hypothetical protein